MTLDMIRLPDRPKLLHNLPVAAWEQPVVIPTYPVLEPNRNPMFLDRRVYQGSSGRVYPNAVTDRVSGQVVERSWSAVHLENDYVRLMVLPEIGGRIHVGMDRTNGYDFFYRQNVIKPALVGLLGPWISGGVELNWPQHHRPSSFMALDWAIEDLADGGRTVWCSEHEPMGRMKGMHGVTLRPGSSVVELRVRLFNRTPEPRTFLWWANAAARVHGRYQSFFPPDVTYVADHAKRATSTFPVARATYYGIDYGALPAEEADLSWYKNIPVPMSYMAMGTRGDFFGGYDHAAEAGFVHWADHRISPGKKQWTWGSGTFGQAWDRELTDEDGPYVELMAGVYTDNQPDFSFLAPYETKSFRQYWYPIRAIGPVHAATLDAALSLAVRDGAARIGVAVTRATPHTRVRLWVGGSTKPLFEHVADLSPSDPLVISGVPLPPGVKEADLVLSAHADERELVRYRPRQVERGDPPPPAREPAAPQAVQSVEELYLIGLHLQQYRHATRRPEAYWQEALCRAPKDSRCNAAMGWWHLERGELAEAASRFRTAISTLTRFNPNPYDGGPFYGLGLALRYAGQLDEADEAFAKAAWSRAWREPSLFARARLACRCGAFPSALALLDEVVDADPDQLTARNLRAALWRRLGEQERAVAEVEQVLARDPLDVAAMEQRGQLGDFNAVAVPRGAQAALDVAHDYAAAGVFDDAARVLRRQLSQPGPAGEAYPMLHYTLAWVLRQAGDNAWAGELERAAATPPDHCFPSRIEEIEILGWAMEANPLDARAPYYLGNLLYDRRRYREALSAWRRATRLDPTFPTAHRNLGIAEYNVLRRPGPALAEYKKAFAADPSDARVLYELDQLRKRRGEPPADRLRLLYQYQKVVEARDDLTVELVTLLNETGSHEEALAVLARRRWHPWEGGEGLVPAQWVLANLRLANRALQKLPPAPSEAIAHLQAALGRPPNLGEGKHLLTPENELHYYLGVAHRLDGHEEEARTWFERAAAGQGDSKAPAGEPTYWRARANIALGDEDGARALLQQLLLSARRRSRQPQLADYFATSLPAFLVFEDDLDLRNRVECRYLESLALAGLGRPRAAARGLREVVALDVDHARAAWHLRELGLASRPLRDHRWAETRGSRVQL